MMPTFPSFANEYLIMLPLALCGLLQAANAGAVDPGLGYIALPIEAVETSTTFGKRHQVPVTNGLSGYEYVVDITIGSDNQTVPLVFDTGSDITWVNPVCANAPAYVKEECSSGRRYSPLTSTTAKIVPEALNTSYGSGRVLGVYFKDRVQLGPAVIKDQQFAALVDMQKDFGHHGLLGAQFKGRKGLKHTTFMQSLADQKQISSAAFSLDLRSRGKTGSLILSGIDTKKYKGNLEKVPSKHYGVYLTGFAQTLPNGTTIKYPPSLWNPENDPKGLYVWIDSGTPANLLPNDLVVALSNDYPGSVQYFVERTPFWSIPCEAPNGTFDFTFGQKVIKVSYTDLVVKMPKGNCSMHAVLSPPDGSIPKILGNAFLRGVYAVFDAERDGIWLAESADCGSNILPIGGGKTGVPRVGGCRNIF